MKMIKFFKNLKIDKSKITVNLENVYSILFKHENTNNIKLIKVLKSDRIVTRINIFYTISWILKKEMTDCSHHSKFKIIILNYILKKKLSIYNKEKFLPLFSNEYNSHVYDELNRNYRVIFLTLDDYFNDNIMNRELEEIISDDILSELDSSDENIEEIKSLFKNINKILI